MPIGKLGAKGFSEWLFKNLHTTKPYHKVLDTYAQDAFSRGDELIGTPNFPVWTKKKPVEVVKDFIANICNGVAKKFSK